MGVPRDAAYFSAFNLVRHVPGQRVCNLRTRENLRLISVVAADEQNGSQSSQAGAALACLRCNVVFVGLRLRYDVMEMDVHPPVDNKEYGDNGRLNHTGWL